jgi:hypothetical protein
MVIVFSSFSGAQAIARGARLALFGAQSSL